MLAGSEPKSQQFGAALLMVASGFFFTIHIVLGKSLSSNYDPGLLAFYRSVISLIWVMPFVARLPLSSFKTQKPGSILIRSVLGTAGFLFSFYAISKEFGIPISQFNAISFSRSLFVVLLAALLLREEVGSRRWIATAIGFVGVLVMVRPDTGLDTGSILALASALCFAVSIILVKTLSKAHSPLVLLTYANVLSAVFTPPLRL